MPKLNKPRHRDIDGTEARAEQEAAEWLDLASVQEAAHCSDGSMIIVHEVDGRMFTTVIEHDPPYATAIHRLLKAAGIEVRRG